MIVFRTLGTLELSGSDAQELRSVVVQSKVLALLSYLVVCSPNGYHRRDTLLGLLWPEYPDERARPSLSQALHLLRKGLGEGVVEARGQEEVRINPGELWCDAVAFGEAVANRDYATALELYRGDLLEGLFVSEAPGFERWLEDERVRLKELAAGAAWKLAQQRIDAGELVEAERTAQRALLLVPTDESEVRHFVDALADAGDRAAAVRFYGKFAQRLRDDYELEPAPETKQLVEAVRSRTESLSGVASPASAANQLCAPAAGAAPNSASAGPVALEASGRPSRVKLLWVTAAAVVVTLAVVLWVGSMSSDRDTETVFVPNRVVVALFENQTGDSLLDPVALMAADWLTDGLARTGMVEVITSAAVREASQAAQVEGVRLAGSRGILALAEAMHAGLVVSGRLFRATGGVAIHAEVVRLPGATVLGAVDPVTMAPDDPGPALETLRQQVMGLLAVRLDPRLASWASTGRLPPSYEAYREYVAALPLGAGPDVPDVEERIDHALRSARLDSTFTTPLIHVLWLNMMARPTIGESGRFRFHDSIMQVVERSLHLLSPIERHELDAIKGIQSGDATGSYVALRNAAELAPDHLTQFATAAFTIGRYREAVEILERPDLPQGFRTYPWNWLTVSLHYLSEHERELLAARREKQESPSQAAFVHEANALVGLGRIEELEAALDEGLMNGSVQPTELLFQAGNELLWHGYEEEGRAVLERTEAVLRAESQEGTGQLARTLLFLGRFEEAGAIFEQLAAQTPDDFQRDQRVANLALAAAGAGDRATALRISAELGAAERPPLSRGRIALWRAQIAGALGDCDGAVDFLREAVRLGRVTWIHRRYGIMKCQEHPGFRDVVKPRG
jgi:DNA-binding SARP family transcriptional activator